MRQIKSMKYRKSWGKVVKERAEALTALQGPYLDVGCSTGGYVSLLASRGESVAGMDIEESEAWGQAPELFSVGSAQALEYPDNAFETVFSFEVLEHLEQPALALQEMKRVSRRNVLVSLPDCDVPELFRESGLTYNHFSDPTHIQFFTEETLRALFLSAGLETVYVKRINRVSPEKLHYRSRGYPMFLSSMLSGLARRAPWAADYHMTLMALGTKES
jgi:ubiquinone/menaquinone biosynthesis C-methylase UbiE